MYDAEEPAFADLRALLEAQSVPAMQQLLAVKTHDLPALWDIDLLLAGKGVTQLALISQSTNRRAPPVEVGRRPRSPDALWNNCCFANAGVTNDPARRAGAPPGNTRHPAQSAEPTWRRLAVAWRSRPWRVGMAEQVTQWYRLRR